MTLSSCPTPPSCFLRKHVNEAATPNERQLLDLVLRYGTVGRSVLAKETALTVQSVSRLVDGLVQRGLVRFGARVSERGNPASGLGVELVPEGAYTLGISIMTDAVSVVLMNFRGDILDARYEPQMDMHAEPLLARVETIAQQMIGRHVHDRSRLLGAGVAVTGYFVEDGRRLNPPEPLDDFALVNLPPLLSERLGLPVMLENDGAAAAIAESFLGAGRRFRSFAYLYFAAGVGGGIIADGRLLRGAQGNAGEVAGILPLDLFDDRPTLTLLLEMVRQSGQQVDSISDLLERFDTAMPGVEAWCKRVKAPLDMIVSAVGAVVDPQAIVLGGRLPKALAEKLIAGVTIYSAPRRQAARPQPILLPAEVDVEPTAVGAAVLPLKTHFFSG